MVQNFKRTKFKFNSITSICFVENCSRYVWNHNFLLSSVSGIYTKLSFEWAWWRDHVSESLSACKCFYLNSTAVRIPLLSFLPTIPRPSSPLPLTTTIEPVPFVCGSCITCVVCRVFISMEPRITLAYLGFLRNNTAYCPNPFTCNQYFILYRCSNIFKQYMNYTG